MIKTIYILWFQSFENAPELVKRCVNSWKHYNPDWNTVLIDNNNLPEYVNLNNYIVDIANKYISRNHLADIIRSILLNTYGGIWVDATTFCNKPLNEWLPNYINEGFFAFDKPGPDRLISSWFIYSDKNNYIINKWCNETLKYFTVNEKEHPYFIYHYLFGNLYNSDNTFKQIWDKVPKLSANGLGPHYLQEKGMFKKLSTQNKLNIDNKVTPLYKLTYKCNFPKYNENRNLYYLFSTVSYV